MSDVDLELDTSAAQMVAQLDQQIGIFEGRGWLKAAAIAEELVCQIYADSGIDVPAARLETLTKLIGHDLKLRSVQ